MKELNEPFSINRELVGSVFGGGKEEGGENAAPASLL